MTDPAHTIDRREALRRVALLLGGTISAPAIAGVLAGCTSRESAGTASTPRTFSADEREMVATIAEHILPRTDTPGARDAGVHRFIETMMAEYYAPPERTAFLAGLADLDSRAQSAHGKAFLQCTPEEQRVLIAALDAETFAAAAPRGTVPWWRTMKELTLLGYYTSEAGASKELQYVAVPGRFEGCVPVSAATRTWAT